MCSGGEGGIRLHTAGRGLACKPNPSNPPREVRKDFAALRLKKMPLKGHVFWRRGWDSNPRYLAVRLISSQVHSTTLPPLQVGNRCGRFRKRRIVADSLWHLHATRPCDSDNQAFRTFKPPIYGHSASGTAMLPSAC